MVSHSLNLTNIRLHGGLTGMSILRNKLTLLPLDEDIQDNVAWILNNRWAYAECLMLPTECYIAISLPYREEPICIHQTQEGLIEIADAKTKELLPVFIVPVEGTDRYELRLVLDWVTMPRDNFTNLIAYMKTVYPILHDRIEGIRDNNYNLILR